MRRPGATWIASFTIATVAGEPSLRALMAVFLALCLLSRLAYSLNDVFTGRLARKHDRVELAALRGVSLGVTMAPLLFWVPAQAWVALGARWPLYLAMIAVTAGCNVLQNHAARFLPFGLRAALMISAIAVASLVFGAMFFAERLSLLQIGLCFVLVSAAVVSATGSHAAHEIQPDIRKGGALALAAAACMSVAAILTKRLAMETDPLLTAWAWEFGAGAILVGPLLWRWARGGIERGFALRFWRVTAAASPTVIGSGASMVALKLGALGVWGAVAGTQVLFTALLGVWWHREAMGARRWTCFAIAAAAVSGLAVLGR